MLFRRLLPLILFFMVITVAAQNLEQYQWKNRVILLKEVNMDSDWLRAQIKRLQSDEEKLAARDLLVFVIADKAVYDTSGNKTDFDANSIIENYGLANFQGLVLIGKDGGIKLKEAFIVNSKTIFDLIDSMPMRKVEMKN